jgi:CubicO group peptidase (beta-lactamase class C family)
MHNISRRAGLTGGGPGERWEYGIGIDWIGKLIEQVTDQSLEVYFREKIFQPLGMKDSGFLIGSEQSSRASHISGASRSTSTSARAPMGAARAARPGRVCSIAISGSTR